MVVEEIRTFGNRVRSTHYRDFNHQRNMIPWPLQDLKAAEVRLLAASDLIKTQQRQIRSLLSSNKKVTIIVHRTALRATERETIWWV